jgi:chromosome segregation ATPase
MNDFVKWLGGLFAGLFKNVSITPDTKDDYEALLKGGATVNTEWSKLYQTMSEQMKSTFSRVDALEKECNDTREQLTNAIKKLNQEYIDCENQRALASAEIAELKRQNGRLIKRIDELEAEVATLKK